MNELFIKLDLPEPLSEEELHYYYQRYHAGDKQARDEIITRNIRLVIYRVVRRFQTTPYERQELVAVGLQGLIKGVDTFDLNRNIGFSTYAITCIDNAILTFIFKNNEHLNDCSLDQPFKIGKNDSKIDRKENLCDHAADFTEKLVNGEVNKIVRQVVLALPSQEREVIRLYFGFTNNKSYSRKQISRKLGVSELNVSRIINVAIKRITNSLINEEIIEVPNGKNFAIGEPIESSDRAIKEKKLARAHRNMLKKYK